MLAQLADDRLTVAQVLGVAVDLARLRRLESGEGSLDDAMDADWTLETRLLLERVDRIIELTAVGVTVFGAQRLRQRPHARL